MTISTLSQRANENLEGSQVMMNGLMKVNANKYDAKTRPSGIINLGVAENQLMTEELSEIMSQVNTADASLFGYGVSPSGSETLRKHFANNIFNRYFEPLERVLPEHIVIAAGCSAIVDNFTFSVCDPGDGILISTPFYGGFNTDIMVKSKCKVIPAHLENINLSDVDQIDIMQQALDKAESEGTRVRAFIVTNPHNPLGRCYSRELIIEFLKFASKNQIHVLFDEIYALSVFDHALKGRAKDEQPDHNPFISVLSLPIDKYCPKELVHVAYGMSKDFCLNGFRCGCLVSPWNTDVVKAMKSISVFTWIASTTEAMVIKLLENPKNIAEFTKINQARLAKSYTLATDFLTQHNIPYIPAQGGHFIWIDFRQFIPSSFKAAAEGGDHDVEYHMWHSMLDAGVYINPGDAFTERIVGFYRLSFSVPPTMLKEGLDRIIKGLRNSGISMKEEPIY
ncbi:hypothetical protein BGZ76_009835 [Entomortierella beljakovae]|nr:hypothetical protein BGZ76_009835 [Entomortierella beljakovae]